MGISIKSTECCGVKEVKGVHKSDFTPDALIHAIIQHTNSYERPYKGKLENMGFAAYIMYFVRTTVDGKDDKGLKARERIADFLEMHNLGELYESPECPSGLYSGHHFITCVTYKPNHIGIRDYGIKRGWINPTLISSDQCTSMGYGIYNWGNETTGVH